MKWPNDVLSEKFSIKNRYLNNYYGPTDKKKPTRPS